MEIKGKIKEISISESQAKVKLEDGMIISSNQPVQMETVRLIQQGDGEGKDIVADVYVNPGKGKWEGRTFYNINHIALDIPVIQREDELQEPEPPTAAKATVSDYTAKGTLEKESDEALTYTPETATMEIGKLFIQLIGAFKEYDKVFKK